MGIDAVDTLQPEAKDMSPAFLKKRFGGRLAFHGCISTAGPLAFGTVADVVRYCRDTLDVMMPGGPSSMRMHSLCRLRQEPWMDWSIMSCAPTQGTPSSCAYPHS